MFSVAPRKREPIEFFSNPPFNEEAFISESKDERGNICNQLQYRHKSNHSIFEGVHFVESEMSLRAMLNKGVKLSKVSNVNLDNDPTEVQNRMRQVESQVFAKITELEAAASKPQHIEESKIE